MRSTWRVNNYQVQLGIASGVCESDALSTANALTIDALDE